MMELSPAKHVALSSRWTVSPSGIIEASWAGQMICFSFSGTTLKLKIGQNTERNTADNGGTPMLAVSISDSYSFRRFQDEPTTYDPKKGAEITLFDSTEGPVASRVVQLMLIDWASVFELEALVVDENAFVSPLITPSTPVTYNETIVRVPPSTTYSRLLFIGDSISCGVVDSKKGEPPLMPKGCLQAFPFLTQKYLLSNPEPETAAQFEKFAVDLVAYPMWHFVKAAEEEIEKGAIPNGGMEERFWRMGPHSPNSWSPDAAESLSGIVVALGTNDDCIEGITPRRFAQALAEFLLKLTNAYAGRGYPIFFIPPWLDTNEPPHALAYGFQNEVVEYIRPLIPNNPIHYCPIHTAIGGEDTCDGIHPTARGHEILGERLASIFQEVEGEFPVAE